jgi:YfiH family protein
LHEPRLTRSSRAGCAFWTDEALASRTGIVVAFTERVGGVSVAPYSALNLAAHVGDDPMAVDENRSRLMSSLGIPGLRDRLTCAEQVHGTHVELVGRAEAGAGAWASGRRLPVAETDALITTEQDLPLLMFFADCVPVVLVSFGRSGRGVAVVHAGWRGALAGIPASAARSLAQTLGADGAETLAYIGACVCPDHYSVGEDILSQFESRFGTVSRACSGGLDLKAAVSSSLAEAGVPMGAQCCLEDCTAENTDRFYSYRAERHTGRHGALAAILRPQA